MAVGLPEPVIDFPRDVSVVVGNPSNVTFEIFWDSQPYTVPAQGASSFDPEIAWALFAYETRVRDGESPYRNFESGNEGERHQPSYFMARAIAMGIADDAEKMAAFRTLRFKTVKRKKKYGLTEFDKL
jgi:hypothetical protein